MPRKRRTFTSGEKRLILKRACESGVTKILKEYNLSYSVYSRWKKQSEADESENHYKSIQTQVDYLTHENARLKKIIADLMLELETKSEELKRLKF